MLRERVTRQSQAAMLVGWVANADAIFIGLILTLTVTLFVAVRLQRSEEEKCKIQHNSSLLSSQLGKLQEQAINLHQEREQLAKTNLEQRSRIANLGNKLTPLQTERDELKVAVERADKERKRLDAENKNLETKQIAYHDQYLEMKKSLENNAAKKRDETIRLVTATEERDAAQKKLKLLSTQIEAEPGLHKELIGLKGNLRRVVIIFDTSGSMGLDGRWEYARGVVATWLEHLAISECVLVMFSTDVRVFPENGRFLDVYGPGGGTNRQRLLEQIKFTKPEGGTNTLLALQTAYSCANLDTVILFTDGEPNNGNSNKFDPEIAQKIYTLCQQHKDIPVNTVGLGNYFKPELSSFLMRVAQETNGSFLGR